MTNLPAAVLDSLQGLAFGDAFGDRWFRILRKEGEAAVEARTLPTERPWLWSDDTVQALALVRELLAGDGVVDQDRFALRLAAAYAEDNRRGYRDSIAVRRASARW
jgi:ADP-ribosylglycohydrolase